MAAAVAVLRSVVGAVKVRVTVLPAPESAPRPPRTEQRDVATSWPAQVKSRRRARAPERTVGERRERLPEHLRLARHGDVVARREALDAALAGVHAVGDEDRPRRIARVQYQLHVPPPADV